MLDLSTASREDLLALIAALQAENAQLRQRVQALEARLGQNSSNSSRPPSSDPPHAPPRPPQRPSGRRRGAQPGHQGQLRQLVPAHRVATVVGQWPATCCRCRTPLSAAASREPLRHQVLEGPSVQADVIAHRLQRVR